MSAERTDMHRLQELVRLHRMQTNPREVARLLRMSPNTERRYRLILEKAGLLIGDPDEPPPLEAIKDAVLEQLPKKKGAQEVSSVEPWGAEIRAMHEKEAQPKAIYDALRLQHSAFTGSLSAVRRYCRRLRADEGVRPEDVAIPVETAPGEVIQVDFGYVGKHLEPSTGELRKTWVFVGVLGYSRHMFVRLVFDQKVETWLRLHAEMFQGLGGVPRVIVPDNLKAAVIRAAFSLDEQTQLNRSYRELARHYGCKIDPTPVRAPEKKGKVESAVKYVKNNFFRPRGETDLAKTRQELAAWVRQIAGMRIHGTTGKQPLVVFESEERKALSRLPATSYEMTVWARAKLHRDCHAAFERRFYSAPWQHIGQTLWIRATTATVMIYAEDRLVATHDRRGPGVRSTIESHLPPHRAELRHRSRSFWEERAAKIGPEVAAYVRQIFDADDVLSQLRTVQAVVTHLERFPRHRACAACARAAHFENLTYQGIKRILREGLDLKPILAPRQPELLAAPRFARSIHEILPMEVTA